MKILISNDDGIQAEGISALWEVAREFGEVMVVAPSGERSACGHGIPINAPIMVNPVELDSGLSGVSVGGTPADCIKLALTEFCDSPPDLIISGVNYGDNSGASTLYSGTYAAAREGAAHDIPSIAISASDYKNPHFETAQHVLRQLLETLPVDFNQFQLLNVNTPGVPVDQLKGIRPARLGKSRWIEKFHARTSPQCGDYYWLNGEHVIIDEHPETDIHLIAERYATVVPINLDITHYPMLESLKSLLKG